MSGATPSFYVTGGTLRHDAPSYVERQADHDLLEGLRRGEFCYVLTSRQMGKSSLMVRAAARLREQRTHVVVLDLTAVGQNLTPEQWYDGLLVRIGRQLDLEEEMEEHWQGHLRLSPVQRLFATIRDVALVRRPGPHAVFIDEIDIVRSLPFSTDEFFAAIRECYNRRTEDAEMGRLTFCLLGVATPSDLVRDTRITPFNIGRRIELRDFLPSEAKALTTGLASPTPGALPPDDMLARMLFWTHGHPYLTQRLCLAAAQLNEQPDKSLRKPAEVDSLCEELFFGERARERDDNLLFVRGRLLRADVERAGLLHLYDEVLMGRTVRDDECDPLVSVLRLAGIVRLEEGRLVSRNRIYERVFDRAWVRAQMPEAELVRQRAAFNRGVIRTTAIAALVVAAMVVMVIIAANQARQKSEALAKSKYSEAQARRASGTAGQREESLRALREARKDYRDEAALRNEAIACMALVDLEKEDSRGNYPPGTTAAALNPSLTHHAWSDSGGAIWLAGIGEERSAVVLPPTGLPVSWIALSPDARFAAAQYVDESLARFVLWDVQAGKTLLSWTNQLQPNAVDFSADSSKAAMGFSHGAIEVVSLREGGTLATLRREERTGLSRISACVRLDSSGERLAESSANSTHVRIWRISDKTFKELAYPSPVRALAWSSDGNHLAAASEAHDLFVWDLQFSWRHELARSLSGAIDQLAFNPQGTLLASLGPYETLRLWTLATGRPVTQPLGAAPSGRLCFSEDGLVGHATVELGPQLWRIQGGTEYQVFRAPTEFNFPFNGLSFSPEGRVLIAANDVGAFFWDTATGRTLYTLNVRSIKSVFTHPSRGDLFVSTPDGLHRWPRKQLVPSEAESFTFGHSKSLDLTDGLGLCTLAERRKLAAVVHADHIHCVDLDDRQATSMLPMRGNFQAMELSPDGQWLATWSSDQNQIQVWALDTAHTNSQPITTLPGGPHFAFTPDGKFLVCCWDKACRLFKTGTWEARQVEFEDFPDDAQGPLALVRAEPEGRTLLAIAASAAVIHLFELDEAATGFARALARLKSPDRVSVHALAFNPDGSRLAAAAKDQTVQVWDLARIRQKLAEMDLAGAMPRFERLPERPLRVVFESEARDLAAPKRWREIEQSTVRPTSLPD